MKIFIIFFSISINTLMCRGANKYFFIAPNISMILECKNDVILDDMQCHDRFRWKLVPLDPTTAYLIKKQVYLKPRKVPSYLA
jgi:hypothetical protein